MSTIVLTGGGTAGHIMPNLALIPELSSHFDNIIYLGGNGMEKSIVPSYGIKFYETATVKLDRSHLLSNFKIPYKLLKGISQAKKIFKECKPDVVFSKGGYAALPACYAAKSLNIPVIIHESDYTMGVANKMCAKFAKKVLTSFPETQNGLYVGNPIRNEIFKGDKLRAKQNYNLDERTKILIFGGSLGAEAINNVVYKAADKLAKDYTIIHITGKNPQKLNIKGYHQIEYAKDINDLYAAADLVVIRGGANSLCEATALGKRTICIPLPKGGSRGDQLDNALSFEKRFNANIILQDALSDYSLISRIDKLLKEPAPKPLINQINKKIVEEIINI